MSRDYLTAGGRSDYRWLTTVAEQSADNVRIHDGVGEEEFVAMRLERDRGLAARRLLLPSVQVNIRAGEFPPAEANGVHHLKIPLRLPD